MEGINLQNIQEELSNIKYLIDKLSMVSRKTFGMIDRRLRQAFPHKSQVLFGWCSVLLFGDFGQLQPVFGLPLYTTQTSSDLADQGPFPMVEDVADYNANGLLECGHPIAEIKAVHTGANASSASPDAGGLDLEQLKLSVT
uniref:ATP-dependent DNA helicase n=1 Tax=Amphimedon queenslandica TaxID=400682 RepID=A0A1X7U0X2_AMPQE